jgi:hypothetical protein
MILKPYLKRISLTLHAQFNLSLGLTTELSNISSYKHLKIQLHCMKFLLLRQPKGIGNVFIHLLMLAKVGHFDYLLRNKR